MDIDIEIMTIEDYDEVIVLWNDADGVGLSDADARENVEYYLRRNPDLSFVARHDGGLVGAVLSGHDGRRGYLHHLAVDARYRNQGIGRALVHRCISGLRAIGIHKCNTMVFTGNAIGKEFWQNIGWNEREDLILMQTLTESR